MDFGFDGFEEVVDDRIGDYDDDETKEEDDYDYS